MSERYDKLAMKFKSVIIQFLNELINITDRKYDDLILAKIMIENQIPISLVIEEFIEHGLKYEKQVSNRDEGFFLSDQNIFDRISKIDSTAKNKFNLFKNVWNNIGQQNKNTAWTYVDLLFKIVNMCKAELNAN